MADPTSSDASSLRPIEVALVGQQVQDGGPDTWEKVGPLVDQQLELGVGRRVCCANCAGFCAAFGVTVGFPLGFRIRSNPVLSAVHTERDIDEATTAFEQTVLSLFDDGMILRQETRGD